MSPADVPAWQLAATHARHDLDDEGASSLDVALHVSRYHWVRDGWCAPGTVAVDLGCGTGFGVGILAEHAERVVGVDFSDDGLARARAAFARPNASFVRADLTSPSLADEVGPGAFDLVTSMETIEHLADYFTFVANASRLVAPSGTFVVATPNRRMTYERYPERRHMDPSHVQEFTRVALEHTLHERFGEVELHLQCIRGFWDGREAAPAAAPGRAARALRPWLPPRLVELVRARRHRDGAAARVFSVDDVEIVPAAERPELEAVAFCLIAVCRSPQSTS